MAEALGFVFAIAGLYSSCIDAFDQIRAARSFGRDYEILSTRFDVRKARFLQWGDGVGLLNAPGEGQHPNLESSVLRPAVEKVLHCIKMLLTQTENLKSKYGLEEIVEFQKCNGATPTYAPAGTMISDRRRDLFKESYVRFQARLLEGQVKTSLARKTQWAIVGRHEFESLISDLDGMIEDLFKLAPLQKELKKSMTKEDIDALPEDASALKVLREACTIDTKAEDDDHDHWLELSSGRLHTSGILLEESEPRTPDRRHIKTRLAGTQWELISEPRNNTLVPEPILKEITQGAVPLRISSTSPPSSVPFHYGVGQEHRRERHQRLARRFCFLKCQCRDSNDIAFVNFSVGTGYLDPP